MNKRFLIFRHNEDCPPGTTLQFFKNKNWHHEVHFWPQDKILPDMQAYSGLVVLGGPQNVDEEHQFPWLREEKKLIQQFLRLNRPVLGICLGAQLLAEALGAKVYRHKHEEIGWHKVKIDAEVSPLIPARQHEMTFFQWHGYRFHTPDEAVRFASNEATEDQGFVYRDNVVAVQFHPESEASWIEFCSQDPEFPAGPFVRPREELMQNIHFAGEMNTWYFELLHNLFSKA